MLFADFGDDSPLQLASLAMAGSDLSHPPMMPSGFLPVEVDDGAMAPANGRSPMPPRLRPKMAIQRSHTPLFGAFGLADDVAPGTRVPVAPRMMLAPPLPSTKTAPAPAPILIPPMPSAALIPSPVDPYATAPVTPSGTHWGWWALGAAGAVGAIAGVVLLVGGRRKRR